MTLPVALVTGGTRGIGLAIAQNLLTQGYQVYICSRSGSDLPLQENLYSLKSDISSPQAVEDLFKHFNLLQVLVNAAGVSALSHFESESDPQVWQEIINTNLNGAYYCSRQAILLMKSQKFGRIINIASVLGLRGMRNHYAYCAAKHGMIGLTRAMAQDVLEYGITINAVCPGWVDTQMGKQSMATIAEHYGITPEEFEQAEIQAVPLGRWIESHEVAAMVNYLISPQAGAITGQALEISGGL